LALVTRTQEVTSKVATVTVKKPDPKLVPASSVKGYRPDWHGFVGDPSKRNPPTGFVLATGPRHGSFTTTTPTKAPGATLKVGAKNTGPHTQVASGKRTGPTFGKADPRFILGVGRTIIPHNGISIANANGGGI
jgi:hypothetical protein